MPLTYDDEDGSWGRLSEGWPTVPYSVGRLLLCTKTEIVPYGSYVVMRPKYPSNEGGFIRIETEELRDRLEWAYYGIFVECRDLLKEEFR